MTDVIRLVDYFYITIGDRPGEGGRALNVLRDAGVHLNAFHAFPTGRRAQLDFVPSDPAAFKAAAKTAKWKVTGPKKAFVIESQDRYMRASRQRQSTCMFRIPTLGRAAMGRLGSLVAQLFGPIISTQAVRH